MDRSTIRNIEDILYMSNFCSQFVAMALAFVALHLLAYVFETSGSRPCYSAMILWSSFASRNAVIFSNVSAIPLLAQNGNMEELKTMDYTEVLLATGSDLFDELFRRCGFFVRLVVAATSSY